MSPEIPRMAGMPIEFKKNIFLYGKIFKWNDIMFLEEIGNVFFLKSVGFFLFYAGIFYQIILLLFY